MGKIKYLHIGLGKKVIYNGRELTIGRIENDLVILYDGNQRVAVTKIENIKR